jgi:hypothetical protein
MLKSLLALSRAEAVGYFQNIVSAGAAMPMRWMRSVGINFSATD